ncbi:ribonuclease P 40kDa subunit [Truncatella angustata]|uniref:Ribonuclease P 40kDa subunit n=1 Tax=Truncatella angustata TaxID=152316 RepID=A0A9P8ZUD5_9PEZI|nr:ribonuclease P 40kDa subunit [Truncatella angustata]KAH6648233.1 ribonuclease P 40kDa subunit [Truncatella angustata]
MMSFPTPSVYQSSKCFFTHGTMAHPDPEQLPAKGKPWSTLLEQDFIHKVDLILPQEAAEKFRMKLAQEAYSPTYHRVIMKLGDILDGEFFTQYIKVGNIIMLSEGSTAQDNVFALKDGTLTMFLEKESYERGGLQNGKPHGVRGKRGLQPRWIVEYDLRNKANFPGKKGYDQLLRACDRVFDKPITWLFHRQSSTPDPDPLLRFSPVKYTSAPFLVEELRANTPSLNMPAEALAEQGQPALDEFATEVYEWLSLLRLQSPRVYTGDSIDPFLSRYSMGGGMGTLEQATLCKVSWQGFIAPGWTRQALAGIILSISSRSWFSLSVTSFRKGVRGESTECTLLRPPDMPGEYLLWDIHGHE